MGENTKIEWAHHSWSPWRGCTKVSPGCDNCYAEAMAERFRTGGWGPGVPRVLTAKSGWKKPLAWNRRAEREDKRYRVFPSLCDPFDAEVPDEWRDRLFALIALTPNLDWLLLTKRPKVAAEYMANPERIAYMAAGYAAERVGIDAAMQGSGAWPMLNVWLGVSVENQKMAELRIPTLLKIPAVKHFISYEPALGPVDFSPWIDRISWVIVGGESGPGARPMHPAWARSVRDQCLAAGVPFFFKQHGEWLPWESDQPPCWRSQNGQLEDGHALFPTDMDADRNWDDGLTEIEHGHVAFHRVGKKAAGRLLDGREWNEVPS